MFISDIKEKVKEKKSRGGVARSEDTAENRQAFNPSKTCRRYIIAAVIIAAAAQVYGLFSHGVHSAFMTFAFLVPLLGGALPYFAAAHAGLYDKAKNIDHDAEAAAEKPEGLIISEGKMSAKAGGSKWNGIKDVQLAVIATLTAGSLLKGALDIYGTTNRLLIAYPLAAAVIIAAGAIMYFRKPHISSGDSMP